MCSLTIILLPFLAVVVAFPNLNIGGGNIEKCHTIDCPPNTSICERNSTTLESPSVIRTVISCKDIHGRVLRHNTVDEPNVKGKGYRTNVYKFSLNYSKSNKQIDNYKI